MKGQWFIISAVIASSVFLGISFMLKDYFAIDTSLPAQVRNDFYFHNIEEQLKNIVTETVTEDPPVCINLTTNLGEFKTITEQTLGARGLFLDINYIIRDCSAVNVVDFDLIVASQDEIIYNFTTLTDPSEIIG